MFLRLRWLIQNELIINFNSLLLKNTVDLTVLNHLTRLTLATTRLKFATTRLKFGDINWTNGRVKWNRTKLFTNETFWDIMRHSLLGMRLCETLYDILKISQTTIKEQNLICLLTCKEQTPSTYDCIAVLTISQKLDIFLSIPGIRHGQWSPSWNCRFTKRTTVDVIITPRVWVHFLDYVIYPISNYGV